MKALAKLLGLCLMLFGIYYLGQNVVFDMPGRYYAYRYAFRLVSAKTSVLLLAAGVMGLVFLPNRSKGWAWGAVIGAIVLVFASGSIWLQPTNLWQFLVALLAMVSGYRLMLTGKVQF